MRIRDATKKSPKLSNGGAVSGKTVPLGLFGFRYWIYAGKTPVAGFRSLHEARLQLAVSRPGRRVKLHIVDTTKKR